jgi:hypothetical protein
MFTTKVRILSPSSRFVRNASASANFPFPHSVGAHMGEYFSISFTTFSFVLPGANPLAIPVWPEDRRRDLRWLPREQTFALNDHAESMRSETEHCSQSLKDVKPLPLIVDQHLAHFHVLQS